MLLQFKANNPKYYGNIIVDEQQLMALSKGNVPVKIKSIICHNKDKGYLDKENNSYVFEKNSQT